MEQKQNKKLSSRLLYGLKFIIKWFWLIAMFLLGLAEFSAMPLVMFEYSYSLSELDLIETLFLVFLVVFVYHYIKLCCQVKAPMIRKIIMPWVHQAHLLLVCLLGSFIAFKWFDFELGDYRKSPLLDVISTILMMVVLVYSYVRLPRYAFKQQKPEDMSEKTNEGVTQ